MKKSKILYDCWLVFAAIMIIGYALEYDTVRQHVHLPGAARTGGLLIFALTDILCILMFATGHISWSCAISEKEEALLPRSGRMLMSLRQMISFLLATALYSYYCFGLADVLKSDIYRDSIVAGGLLCLAAISGAGKRTISDI